MIEERNKEKVGSLYRDVWDQFKKHKGALFGGVVFLLIVISPSGKTIFFLLIVILQ